MTAKEKANELVNKFRIHQPVWEVKDDAKKCALIAVDEILDALFDYDTNTENYLRDEFKDYASSEVQNMDSDIRYWEAVKQELEKL
jgi:hypothetical protein